MKTVKLFFTLIGLGLGSILLMSADHIDAPAVTGQTTDITDFYAFESPENSDNMVFVTNLQGLLSPMSTSNAFFDEDVLIEINIDNDGDLTEDLVIQAIPRNGKMYVFGPFSPDNTGLSSFIESDNLSVSVGITEYGETPKINENNNVKVFAGPRDDPFFFDLTAYLNILDGSASGFSDPGTDTFAGTNVLSLVTELPKSELGNAETLNTWVETKSRQ